MLNFTFELDLTGFEEMAKDFTFYAFIEQLTRKTLSAITAFSNAT